MQPAQTADKKVATSSTLVAKHSNGVLPGERRGGRHKGVPNKFNADLRNMILTALSAHGGAKYLIKQADKNPIAFMSLLGRILPTTVQTDPNAPLQMQTEITFRVIDQRPIIDV